MPSCSRRYFYVVTNFFFLPLRCDNIQRIHKIGNRQQDERHNALLGENSSNKAK